MPWKASDPDVGRPVGLDWLPLGWFEDPVQGDPERVTSYARQLRYAASVLREQNSALRRIAANGTEIGAHADRIRTLAQTVSGSLLEVANRYERVASALFAWAPQLEAAQAASWRVLDAAEIPYAQLKGSQQYLTADAAGSAREQLADLRTQLAGLLSQRDNDAATCAQLINDASSDGLTDSWWDDFLGFINEYAWVLADVATVLEVAAAALAVVALFVSGGWLVAAALALTGAALADRALLAATGNGSWLDVAVDAAALVSIGIGGEVFKTAEGIEDAAEHAGAADKISTDVADSMNRSPYDPASDASPAVPRTTYEAPKPIDILRAGSRDNANLAAQMRATQAANLDNEVVQKLGGTFDGQLNALRVWTAASLGVPVTALGAGGFPVSTPDGEHQLYHWSLWDGLEAKTTKALPGFRLAESPL